MKPKHVSKENDEKEEEEETVYQTARLSNRLNPVHHENCSSLWINPTWRTLSLNILSKQGIDVTKIKDGKQLCSLLEEKTCTLDSPDKWTQCDSEKGKLDGVLLKCNNDTSVCTTQTTLDKQPLSNWAKRKAKQKRFLPCHTLASFPQLCSREPSCEYQKPKTLTSALFGVKPLHDDNTCYAKPLLKWDCEKTDIKVLKAALMQYEWDEMMILFREWEREMDKPATFFVASPFYAKPYILRQMLLQKDKVTLSDLKWKEISALSLEETCHRLKNWDERKAKTEKTYGSKLFESLETMLQYAGCVQFSLKQLEDLLIFLYDVLEPLGIQEKPTSEKKSILPLGLQVLHFICQAIVCIGIYCFLPLYQCLFFLPTGWEMLLTWLKDPKWSGIVILICCMMGAQVSTITTILNLVPNISWTNLSLVLELAIKKGEMIEAKSPLKVKIQSILQDLNTWVNKKKA